MLTNLRIGAIYLFYLSLIVELCFRVEVSTIPGFNLHNIAVFIIILTILVGNRFERRPVFALNKMNVPIVLFVSICFLSLFITYTFKVFPGYKLLNEIRFFRLYMEAFIFLILFYNLVHDISSIKHLLIAMLVLYAIINILTLLGSFDIIQVGKVEMRKGLRASGAFGGPNQYAAFITLFIPFSLSLFIDNKSMFLKILIILLLATSFFCLFFSGSRGGIVSAVAGINAYIFFSKRDKSISFLIKIITTWLMISVLLFGTIYILPDSSRLFLKKNLIDRAINEEVMDEYRSDYSSGRLTLWKSAISIFSQNPIIGSGWRTYQRIIKNNTHNDYLLFLAETGIIGFSSFIFIFYRLFTRVLKYRKKPNNLGIYYNAFLAGLVSLMTSMFFQNMYTTFIFFFIFSGLIIKMGDLDSIPTAGESLEYQT